MHRKTKTFNYNIKYVFNGNYYQTVAWGIE